MTSGVHKTTTEVKVIIIAVENQILLRFDNPTSEVDKYDDEVGMDLAIFELLIESWLHGSCNNALALFSPDQRGLRGQLPEGLDLHEGQREAALRGRRPRRGQRPRRRRRRHVLPLPRRGLQPRPTWARSVVRNKCDLIMLQLSSFRISGLIHSFHS